MHERAANGVQAVAPDPLALYEQRRIEVMRRNQDAQARIERDLGGQRPASASPPVTRQAPQGSRDGIATPRLAVDLDTAGAEAIASLPWVGPALAARIVADRAARGPFGSLAALERVRGVGPGLTAKIAQFVVFSRSGSPGESVVKFRAVRVRPKRP
jgi:DNA uptake protein ComE-like DNA-binding protein